MIGKIPMKTMFRMMILALLLCAVSLCAVADTTSVSYLGPEGTYTEEASQLFFGMESTFLPQKTVTDAVR